MARISVRGVSRAYSAGTPVLDGIDLDVADGELVGLLGPSGCGKSTLLRCVAGLDWPQRGSIAIGGRAVADPAARRRVPPEARNVGMVFQNYALWPHLTAAQNVAYPLRRRGVRGAAAERRALAALDLVGLPGVGRRRPSQLSGGQQQRVSIARAIVAEPSVLLFDEPLSNLDANLRRSLRREIHALHERTGTTTLYVTHDQDEIGALADRVAVLADGRVAQVGTPREVFTRPANERVARFVGFDVFLSGVVAERDGDQATVLLGRERVRTPAVGLDGAGAPVWLAARGRALTVWPAGDAPTDGRAGQRLGVGTLTSVSRLGDSVEVEVELATAGTVVAVLDVGHPLGVGPGERVLLGATELVALPAGQHDARTGASQAGG